MPIIETRDGTELYVKDWGEGRPVVMIHGWPLSADMWDDQAMALAEAGCRVIAYDRRGFGRSDQPWEGYDYDTFADDLADVMAAAEIESGAALVAFSMGTGDVARYMSRHGGRGVSQAALVAPVLPLLLRRDDNPDGFDPAKFARMTGKLVADRADFYRSYFKTFFGVGVISHPVSQAVLDWAWGMAMEIGVHPALVARLAFGTTDFRPEMAAFRVPTLIVHGTSDSDAPIEATGRAAAQAIAGARLIEYEGAPHGLFATHKDQLSQDLLSFLAERGGRA